MAAIKISLVTVVFESEFPLMVLQAQSVAQYFDADQLGQVVVIDNSARGMSQRFRQRLMASYGPISGRVNIIRASEVRKVPATTGWRSQQIMKLAIAASVPYDHYISLDAKNIFVSHVDRTYFISSSGQAKVSFHPYVTHPLRADLRRVLRYLDVDSDAHVDLFSATATPFVFDTQVVRRLIKGIEDRSGQEFAKEFVDQNLLEFFLYSGWILREGMMLSDVMEAQQMPSINLWPRNPSQDALRKCIEEAESTGSPVFSVHRTALLRMDQSALTDLASFWASRQLFASDQAARKFLNKFRRTGRRLELIRKIREAPLKISERIHTLVRRPKLP